MMRGPGIRPNSIRNDILGTHVDIMPTLIGLANFHAEDIDEKGRSSAVPSTMDGEDLSFILHRRSPSPSTTRHENRRTAILIEYIGLGDVVRYNHLEDTYNNTYRALRIIDETQPTGRRNLKYVEYFDWRDDWNSTKKPLELELFDLDDDPYEMVNLISHASKDFISSLRQTTQRLFTCVGQSCRDVTSTIKIASASLK